MAHELCRLRCMERMYFYQRKLQDLLTERVERNPRYSLRAFAQLLGLDPGTFSQVLSGKRFPSEKLAQNIFKNLELSPAEQNEFLRSLADAKKKAGLKRISPELRKLLKEKVENTHGKELSLDLFKTIADWYHFAILELPFTPDFKSDPQWIATALGISVTEAHSAIQRLISLELLELVDGNLKRVDSQLTSADKHLTTAAHKKRQKQILEKSIESLENDPIEVRNHSAMTFAIDSTKLPEAKKRIEKFIEEMTSFLESGERDRVYEMTVNLFPTQKLKKKKKENRV
jgi:uncharacterized protein (TIGR02147 family)